LAITADSGSPTDIGWGNMLAQAAKVIANAAEKRRAEFFMMISPNPSKMRLSV
jgi:hypothetical protein